MKICIITPGYPTSEGKGGYFFVQQLVNEFVRHGHICSVIAPENITTHYFVKRSTSLKFEEQKVDDIGVVKVYRPRYYGRAITFLGVQWATFSARMAVENTIRKNKINPDILYCHFFRSAVLAYNYSCFHNIPLYVATGESQIPIINKPCKKFQLEKFSKQLSGVICVSNKNKEEAINLNYANKDQCIVLPNGVDLSIFKKHDKNKCRNMLNIPISDFIVICVGNFSERKGQNRLIEAVNKLNRNNIKLILLGNGDNLISSYFICYKGFCEHSSLPVFLSAADVFVLPTRWEGCCNSIVEAMACGLPIVSSDKSFNYDIIDSTNSILINPDDINAISEAIEILYNNKEMRELMGTKSFFKSQNLSLTNRATNILNFINERKLNN